MDEPLLEVAAPSRLHFGLLSFGWPDRRQYGGCGAMIERPGLVLRFWPSERLQAFGFQHERAMHFAHRFLAHYRIGVEPPYCIEIRCDGRPHTGLGTGTSLGLAVATGLRTLLKLPPIAPHNLALSVGRGARSAVGVHGFLQGGLIVEAGKRRGEELSPLVCRVELPSAWHFVLICPRKGAGLCGDEESSAFRHLPPVPPSVTRDLWAELMRELVPAARLQDFARFSESLFHYGNLAGQCFAKCQHGAYATARMAEIVSGLREAGVRGVGQSSWGPTLFALQPDKYSAETLVEWLFEVLADDQVEFTITPPNNEGARVTQPGYATLTD
jgi:beta-RFAP synthase